MIKNFKNSIEKCCIIMTVLTQMRANSNKGEFNTIVIYQ